MLSTKPNIEAILFAVAVVGLIHCLQTRGRLRTTSRSPTPVVPIGMKEEGLAHFASIGGQLATGNNKSVVDQVKGG